MSTMTRERPATPRISQEFELMLASIDERVAAIELSDRYAWSLTTDEWLALRRVAMRNRVPLTLL